MKKLKKLVAASLATILSFAPSVGCTRTVQRYNPETQQYEVVEEVDWASTAMLTGLVGTGFSLVDGANRKVGTGSRALMEAGSVPRNEQRVYNNFAQERHNQRNRSIGESSLTNAYFTCNYHHDFNGDGEADPYLGEFVGIKDRFGTDERITIAARVINRKGQTLKFEVFDSHGDFLTRDEVLIPSNGFLRWARCEPGQLPEGSYAVAWYVDDNHVGTSQFTVSDK